jgi:hypothetical protein
VLVSCDAFDNFPPGLTGRTLVLSGKCRLRYSGCSCSNPRAARRHPDSYTLFPLDQPAKLAAAIREFIAAAAGAGRPVQ